MFFLGNYVQNHTYEVAWCYITPKKKRNLGPICIYIYIMIPESTTPTQKKTKKPRQKKKLSATSATDQNLNTPHPAVLRLPPASGLHESKILVSKKKKSTLYLSGMRGMGSPLKGHGKFLGPHTKLHTYHSHVRIPKDMGILGCPWYLVNGKL